MKIDLAGKTAIVEGPPAGAGYQVLSLTNRADCFVRDLDSFEEFFFLKETFQAREVGEREIYSLSYPNSLTADSEMTMQVPLASLQRPWFRRLG